MTEIPHLNATECDPEIFYELMVYAEWRQDPDLWTNLLKGACEHLEKPNLRKGWFGFMQKSDWPEKELLSYWSLLLPWLISVSPNGQHVALLQDAFLEVRSSREDFRTVMGRAAVPKDKLPQCRKMVWSPDSVLIAVSSSEGVVCVYDLFAIHLFSIPKPAAVYEGNKRFVVGFEFVHSPIKLQGWDLSLIVVYSDGTLYSYYISSEGRYVEGHSVRLSLCGISSATFSEKYNMLFLSTKPQSAPISCEDNSLSAGISSWRVISENPYYEMMFPTEEERKMINATHYFWKITNCMKSMTCIAKMRVSPKSNWLATFHCCGAIRIWHIPGLRLYRQWVSGFKKGLSSVDDEHKYKKRLITTVDIEWRSDEALIVTWDNGTISIHNIDNFEITYGSDPELVHGRLRVSSSLSFKGFLALECELVFISASGEENVVEDDDNDKSVLDATSEFIQAVLYLITDSVEYIPVRKPNQLTRRIYRLLGIKSITPEERYFFFIEDEEFGKALDLASRFSLNKDRVYQKQWAVYPVSSISISEYLINVSDEAWILHECTSRVAETLEGVHELQKFGLNFTDFDHIFKGIQETDMNKICVESLTELQKLKLKTRLTLLRYAAKLEIYELILKEHSEIYQFNMDFYKKLRNKHMVEIAIIYARDGNATVVETIFKKYSSVVSPCILVILSNFPETLDPHQYSNVLPQSNSEGVPSEWPLEKVRPKDWVENDKFKFLIEEETVPIRYSRPCKPTDTVLTEWYNVRAVEIERFSGIIHNAVKLLHIGKDFNVQGLDRLLSDFLTAEVLVLQLHHEIDFLDFIHLPPLDKAQKLIEKSTEDTLIFDIQKYLIPYFSRCDFKTTAERFDLFLKLMVKVSSTKLNLVLKFFKYVLNGNLNIVGTAEELIKMINDCIYSYEKLDRLEESLDVAQDTLSWLSVLSDTPINRSLSEIIYVIREEICATEILQKYKIIKSLTELHNLRNNENDITGIIKKMTKQIVKVPKMKRTNFEKLLTDILFLQEICFSTFPLARCYEIFASAVLKFESLELIEYSTKFICCRKEEELVKPVNYESSIHLILDAARNYFNSSRSHLDELMLLAKACLHLIKGEEEEIMKELDLILAVRLLSEFGVNLLPIQIRNCEDKMKLIECVLDKNQNAYKNVEKLYKLACKLWICNRDRTKRYSVINIRLAEESFKKENFKLCSELCENIMSRVCIGGWPICLKLGTCDRFKENEFKLKLIEFAYVYCPALSCYSVNELRKNLERNVIFNQLKNEFQDVETEMEETEEESYQLSATIFNIQKLLKTLHRSEECTTDVSFNHGNIGATNEFTKSQQKQILKIAEFIMMLLLSNSSTEIQNALFVLDNVLLQCGKSLIFDDSALGLSFLLCLLNREMCEEYFMSLPSNPLTLQLAMYFYCLLQCINESKDFINLTPNEALQCTLSQNDDNINYRSLMKFKHKSDDYWQAQTASDLNCGIDDQRFITDIEYRKDTILGLAMSLDLDKVLIAIRLAEKNYMSLNELAVLHMESFLMLYSTKILEKLNTTLENPTVLKLLNEDISFLKNRLTSTFENLDGCDYLKLTVYFTILNTVESETTIYSLTPKQHLKLMKKVKATSSTINYINLISHKYDLLTILQPALKENFNQVVKLVKHLPSCVKCDFNINILFRTKAVKEFFQTISEVTSVKESLQQIKNIFNKWLNKVEVSDIKLFIEETVWHRDVAISIDYHFRKHILLTLVSWISSRDDYSENIRFLTFTIQTKIDTMDRVWEETENCTPMSDQLRSCLFDLETSENDQVKIENVLIKAIADPKMNPEEVHLAFKACNMNKTLEEFLTSLQESDDKLYDVSYARMAALSGESDEGPKRKRMKVQGESSHKLQLWSEDVMKAVDLMTKYDRFKTLLSQCINTDQIKYLYLEVIEFRGSENFRTLNIDLLRKLVTMKENDEFSMIARLMADNGLQKTEIKELLYESPNGDLLSLIWMCIQSNDKSVEDIMCTFLKDVKRGQLEGIARRIKALPWDIIKVLTRSTAYQSLLNVIMSMDDGCDIINDLMNVLKQIELIPEAASLSMQYNDFSESLVSFSTSLHTLD